MAAPSALDLRHAFGLPPRRAVEYLRGKGHKISWNWWETWEAAHAQSFTVAKALREDLLADIRAEVQRAIDQGLTARQFAANLEPRLQKKGWWGKQVVVGPDGAAELVQLGSPRRLKTIYRTNMRTARAVAHYQVQQDTAAHRPYWMYVSMDDGRVRASHRAMHGLVFRHDDPFWDSHYPPNGFNCRCRVEALTQGELDQRGLKVSSGKGRLHRVKQRVGTDKRSGEIIYRDATEFRRGNLRMTPDPGWNYNPGAAANPFDPPVNVVPPPVGGQADWSAFGLPPTIPLTIAGPGVERTAEAASKREAKRAFLDGVGIDPSVMKPVRVTRADGRRDALWFQVTPAGGLPPVYLTHRFVTHVVDDHELREQFSRFVLPTIRQAGESWLQAVRQWRTGKVVYQTVHLARFTDADDTQTVVVVSEDPKLGTLTWTFYDIKNLNTRRKGKLLYRREEDDD